MDQGQSEGDIDITRRIRKAVVADDSLSFNAKNVKIITQNGTVTLRGPVANEREQIAVEEAAKSVAGKDRVVSELEIEKKK